MKTSRAVSLVALVLISAAVAFGYSAHTASRVRELERRLQRAEAELQSHSQSLADTTVAARIRSLEDRVRRAEAAAAHVQLVTSGGTVGLEQRIQNVEQKIEPHLETLPPYVPSK
jgi:Flp pilus assembly protein TadB